MRLPALGLALEGTGAALATHGEWLGHERGLAPPGEAPRRGWLVPLLVAVPVASGATPTAGLRWLDLLLGSAIGPLLALLARRLGVPWSQALLAGALGALHPLAVLHAGGALPTSAGATTAGFLLAARLALSPGATSRRAGAFGAALLVLADPRALLLALPLLVRHARAEPRPFLRALPGALALLLALPALGYEIVPAGGAGLLGLLVVLGAGPLLVLLPALPGGLARLARRAGGGTVVLTAAGAHLAGAALLPWAGALRPDPDGLGLALPAATVLLLAGVLGCGHASPGRGVLLRAALVLAVAGTVLLALGGPQRLLLGERLAAGRLHALAGAMRVARRAAGPGDAVALDLPGLDEATRARLADLVPGRLVGLPPGAGAGDLLQPLPDDLPLAGRDLLLVAPRGALDEVTTLGGRGIFRQEVVGLEGRWMVVRIGRW